jgi:hypothetical protein
MCSSLYIVTGWIMESGFTRHIENSDDNINESRPKTDSVMGTEIWVAPRVNGGYIGPYVYVN